jgi:hypothetical protein
MELDKKMLEIALKGLNDLEGNRVKYFEIAGRVNELAFLQINYLNSYNIKMNRDELKKEGDMPRCKLIVSKRMINRRR